MNHEPKFDPESLVKPQRLFKPQAMRIPWESAQEFMTAAQLEMLTPEANKLLKDGVPFCVYVHDSVIELEITDWTKVPEGEL